MEEKVLITSQRYRIGRGLLIFAVVVALICTLVYVGVYNRHYTEFATCTNQDDYWDPICCEATDYRAKCRWHDGGSDTPAEYASYESTDTLYVVLAVTGGVSLICLIIFAWMRSYEMIVTDKRVYGRAAFGKRIDLPMDSVSAVATMGFKGIAVATSSGKIAFLMIKNRNEIHKTISELLIERQSKPDVAPTVSTPVASNADELKKYKELLDMGVISQEEFDAKKKQLLGL